MVLSKQQLLPVGLLLLSLRSLEKFLALLQMQRLLGYPVQLAPLQLQLSPPPQLQLQLQQLAPLQLQLQLRQVMAAPKDSQLPARTQLSQPLPPTRQHASPPQPLPAHGWWLSCAEG